MPHMSAIRRAAEGKIFSLATVATVLVVVCHLLVFGVDLAKGASAGSRQAILATDVQLRARISVLQPGKPKPWWHGPRNAHAFLNHMTSAIHLATKRPSKEETQVTCLTVPAPSANKDWWW